MEEIQKYVVQFKREFRIRSLPALEDLERIISCGLYYKLLPYQGNENLFCSLVKKSDIKCRTAVAIRNGDNRYIFYNDNIPPRDRPFIFAHEIAHIYLSHYSRDDGYTDTSYRKEQEANVFATLLLHKRKKHTGICAVCVAAFLLAFHLFSLHSVNDSGNTSAVSRTVKPVGAFHNSEETVIVTTTGKKCHRVDCGHIKNSENLKLIPIDEAIRCGYELCLDCF